MSTTESAPPVPTDPEAMARELAGDFAEGAAERDRAREFPHGQIGALKESGLLASRLPASLGGGGADTPSTIGIIGEIAVGDPNVAQMLLIHYYGVELITNLTSQSQGLQRQLADRVLAGDFITNSFNEVGTKTIMEFRTRVTSDRDHGWRIDGKKFYATGSLAGGPHVRRDHDRRPGAPAPNLLGRHRRTGCHDS